MIVLGIHLRNRLRMSFWRPTYPNRHSELPTASRRARRCPRQTRAYRSPETTVSHSRPDSARHTGSACRNRRGRRRTAAQHRRKRSTHPSPEPQTRRTARRSEWCGTELRRYSTLAAPPASAWPRCARRRRLGSRRTHRQGGSGRCRLRRPQGRGAPRCCESASSRRASGIPSIRNPRYAP